MSLKHVLGVAAGTIITMAVVYRVQFLRQIVTNSAT
jgi:hypothetical protein